MKKQNLLIVLFTLIISFSFAQSVPQGMNYQAVARDKDGEVLADQEIFLKVTLKAEPSASTVNYYTEIHRVVTNKFGLFTLTIGKGSTLTGTWNQIPWSTQQIWMDVAIKMDLLDDYVSLSSTKLLAVPYAYHAGTASVISGSYNAYVIPGSSNGIGVTAGGPVKATSWQSSGNLQINPLNEYLGNGDSLDLLIKTNGIERIRVIASGNINIIKTLGVGIDLNVGRDVNVGRDIFGRRHAVIDSNFTVKRNVNLNTTGGATTNYGPFTVGNVSPSILTGSLRVDQITNLQNGLNVNNATPTLLTGTLRVNNATDLYSSFTVNSGARSVLTGSLRVDSNATFKQRVMLDNPAHNSFNITSGALVVAGGVGIGKNLNVGDSAAFGGPVKFAGQVRITAANAATSDTTGALIVTGGVGIGGALWLGGGANFKSTLNVTGASSLSNTLAVTGATTLGSTLGVTGITTLSNALNANGQVTITANPGSGNQSSYGDYPLRVEGSPQGIAIKVTGSTNRSTNSAGNNNYISFFNEDGTMWGRIEGESTTEMKNNNDDYQGEDNQYTTDIIFGSLDLAFGAYNIIVATSNVLQSVSSSTACVGLGACITTPIPSWIIGSTAQLVVAIAAEITTAAAVGVTGSYYTEWKNKMESSIGVTYESGSGDYAEYLMKADVTEAFQPGDIVGMKGGLISKNIGNAEKVMVISLKPIVLGNMPPASKINDYEKVAFLGQVPVKVFGKVNVGDYILPNGYNNGVGIAVAPADIKSGDVKNIVGIAWSAAPANMQINSINVAVGLNVNDNQKVVDELQGEVNSLKNQIAEINIMLAKLASGNPVQFGTQPSAQILSETKEGTILTPGSDDVIYHELTRDEINQAVEMAEKQMREEGVNIETNPFWSKYKNTPSYRETVINKILGKVKDGIVECKKINKSRNK